MSTMSVTTSTPVRLTGRGRMVVLGLLVLLAAIVLLLAAPPGQAADPPGAMPTTLVRSGDTLWSIAGSYAPGRDRVDVVEEIRRLNHLDGYQLQVGQRLILPLRR
jgi:LysM repeat protein